MTTLSFTTEIGALVEAHERAGLRLDDQRNVAERRELEGRQRCVALLDQYVRPVLAEAVAELTRRELQARLSTDEHGQPALALELSPTGEIGSCSRMAFHCDPAGGLHVNTDACSAGKHRGRTENIPPSQLSDERVREEVLAFLRQVLTP